MVFKPLPHVAAEFACMGSRRRLRRRGPATPARRLAPSTSGPVAAGGLGYPAPSHGERQNRETIPDARACRSPAPSAEHDPRLHGGRKGAYGVAPRWRKRHPCPHRSDEQCGQDEGTGKCGAERETAHATAGPGRLHGRTQDRLTSLFIRQIRAPARNGARAPSVPGQVVNHGHSRANPNCARQQVRGLITRRLPGSQAENAGSIPVIRSQVKAQLSRCPHRSWSFVVPARIKASGHPRATRQRHRPPPPRERGCRRECSSDPRCAGQPRVRG